MSSIHLKNLLIMTMFLVIVGTLIGCGPVGGAAPVPAEALTEQSEAEPVPQAESTEAAESVKQTQEESPSNHVEVAELGSFTCPAKGGTLSYALVGNPSGMDPQVGSRSSALRRVQNQIFDQLITPPLVGETEHQPYLATSWEVSDDGLTYTFHLREGIEFQDGAPFNSEAVKINVERIQNEPTANAQAVFEGVTVETPDEFTVVFKRPFIRATFLDDIAEVSFFSLISPAVLEADPSQDNVDQNPVGTGPYMFSEQIPDDRLILKPNPNWWGGEVCLDEVVIRVIPEAATRILELEAGSVDMIDNVPPDQVNRIAAEYDMLDWAACRVEGIVFNVSTSGPTSDPNFREAFRYAVNQEPILKAIDATGNYNVETSWLSPKGWFYDEVAAKEYLYDLEKAQELWKAAGYEDTDGDNILNDSQTGENIELEFPNGQFNEFFAQVVQGELLKAGIQTNLQILEKDTYYDNFLYAGNYDITLWNSQSATCDPSEMFEQLRSTSSTNIPQLQDPKIDELLDKGLTSFESSERSAIYQELIDYIEPMHLYAFIGEKYVQDNHAANRKVKGIRQDRYRVIKLDQTWIEQ